MKPPATRLLQTPVAWLLLALVVTVLCYWTGLAGPFLLDDHVNFDVIQRWLSGQASLSDVMFTNRTGMFGRPLAMASLALSAALSGYQPFAFKLGNLIVHLLCGCTIYALLRRVAKQDPHLEARANTIAAIVASIWLLHPLHASTVLYAVQRMAQVSAACVLLGMWLYMTLRTRLKQGRSWPAIAGLFAGIPLLTAIGFLAKENAALLPAFCLVLELGCFPQAPRPRAVRAFFGLTLLLPFLFGLTWFATNPARLLGAYVYRDFGWQERLLTQARALCDYLLKIVAPNPPRMGVYTDDFALSTHVLAPPTTLVALLVLLTITVAALRLRRRVPALFVGWGIFLIGHAVESSILPLELYFEHRNYLPMFGVLYALVGLVVTMGQALRREDIRPSRTGAALAIVVLTLLAFGTHARARVWSSERLLVASAIDTHPNSMRAQLAVVDFAVRTGDIPRAGSALHTLTRSSQPRARALGHLNLINLDCATRHAANPSDLPAAVADAPGRITQDETETFWLLYRNTGGACKGVTDVAIGRAVEAFHDRANAQPNRLPIKAELAHTGAQFFARAGDWPRARTLALRAWQPGMPPATAAILVQAQLATGDLSGAERTCAEVAARVDPGNAQDVAGLRWLRGRVDSARRQHSEASDTTH